MFSKAAVSTFVDGFGGELSAGPDMSDRDWATFKHLMTLHGVLPSSFDYARSQDTVIAPQALIDFVEPVRPPITITTTAI